MTCECYKIGGPFIAEDPDCEVHGVDGYYARLENADEEIASLRAELQEARALAYAETGAGPRLWKECWQDEVDKNEMLRSSLSLKEVTAEARAGAIEECALIVENYAAGRTMTGEALKPRVAPSQTSVLIAAAIRQLKGEP